MNKKELVNEPATHAAGFDLAQIDIAVINEYSENYCLQLEAAYGPGMMSEGGAEAIEHLFQGVDLKGKKTADIGAGIGGVALHVAREYGAHVTGLEINKWLVSEATQRIPAELKHLLKFELLKRNDQLPFAANSLDIVFSKGVFVHVEHKEPLFREIMRVLKPGGLLLVHDWLSTVHGQWGDKLKQLIELEGLPLYAQTEADYYAVLSKCGFINVQMSDESARYAMYNRAIDDRLLNGLTAAEKEKLVAAYGPKFIEDAALGYRLIAQSQENGELLVRNIRAQKPA
jgi:phosphoethanolamine N-methyltransferase